MGKGRKNGTTRNEAPPEAGEFTSRDRRVQVALDEIAASAREGLLAVAVGAGLQVMAALMEDDVTAVCGPKGRHDPQRVATRHGHEPGSVALGGRRVPVSRPRMRATDGSGELAVPSYEEFTGTEVMGRMALERMLAGLSTRHYPVGLEPVGEHVEATSSATSKSAVSRRFVRATETALTELLTADLSGLDLVALMIDGVHYAEHCCVVALGIDGEGTKHPLALAEGSTENTTLVRGLLTGLRERGLDTTRPILAVLDGSKALAAGIREVFDRPSFSAASFTDPKRPGPPAPEAAFGGGLADAGGLPRRLGAGRPGPARGPGRRARQDPPRRRRVAARGPGRDTDGAAPGRATHPGPHPALHQRGGVDDLHRRDHSATSSAGVTGPWRCAGAPPAWSRPASSSAGSTAICT